MVSPWSRYTGVTGLPKLEINELQSKIRELEESVVAHFHPLSAMCCFPRHALACDAEYTCVCTCVWCRYVAELESESFQLASAANRRFSDAEVDSRQLEDAMADTVGDLQKENRILTASLHEVEQSLRHKEEVRAGGVLCFNHHVHTYRSRRPQIWVLIYFLFAWETGTHWGEIRAQL
jgi:hypothetical protein